MDLEYKCWLPYEDNDSSTKRVIINRRHNVRQLVCATRAVQKPMVRSPGNEPGSSNKKSQQRARYSSWQQLGRADATKHIEHLKHRWLGSHVNASGFCTTVLVVTTVHGFPDTEKFKRRTGFLERQST